MIMLYKPKRTDSKRQKDYLLAIATFLKKIKPILRLMVEE